MKICILTLGCKVNQYESDSIRLALEKLGNEVSMDLEFADLYIINTCAVTNEAERKSRQMVSKCKSLNPDCKVIITGCASQKDHKQFIDLPNVSYISGVKNKLAIIDALDKKEVQISPLNDLYDETYFPSPSTTRAYVKIQDGCNNFCSYCIIPYLRGRSRSRNIVEIMSEVQELAKTAKEIVITGIDISDYKIDGQKALPILIQNLDSKDYRVRLGSIENSLISEEFMQVAKTVSNLCPHFHLSLQSGSDKVLKSMNRHYTTKSYFENIKKLRKVFKNPAITTDVIVGFPTETEEEFKNTCKFVKKVGFSNIHVFPYSKREGTVAAKMKQIPNSVKAQRVKILQEIAKKLHSKYVKKCATRKHELLIESFDGGYAYGYTENYIRCKIPNKDYQQNQLIQVKLIKLDKDMVTICKAINK